MDKNIKLPEEWKNIIHKLGDTKFEHLCLYLVASMPGFVNSHLRDGSADGHRDIEAELRIKAPDGLTELTEKWRFECKNLSKGVSFEEISTKIHAANLNKIDKFVIMSNMHLTPPCQDEIEKIQPNLYCKVLDWTGIHFQNILFRHPNTFKDFFPDEEIPSRILDISKPQDILKIPKDIGKIFGLEIELRLDLKKFDSSKPEESLAEIIKDNVTEFEKLDANIRSILYLQFASLFQMLNKESESIFFVSKSLEITPKNVSGLLLKGFIYEKFNDLEESDKCYDEVLQLDSSNKFALNNKAHNLQRHGKYDKALVLVDQVLQLDPNFIIAINNKASILKEKRETEKAILFLEAEVQKHQDSNILLITLVQLYIQDLDFKKAYDLNEKILGGNPLNSEALNNKGVIFEHNSHFVKSQEMHGEFNRAALNCFDQVIKLNKNMPVAWANKSVCKRNLELVEDLEALIDSAIELFPSDSYVLKEKAIYEWNRKNFPQALKILDKSLRYNRTINILIQKARLLFAMDKHNEVIQIVDFILNTDSKDSTAWELKGQTLKKLHNETKGNLCLENAKKYKKEPKSTLLSL